MLADIGGEALPGDAADARAHDLDADHERSVNSTDHSMPVAELRARLE